MKKILITGGSGLLGQYLNIELSKDFNILTLYNTEERNTIEYNNAKAEITDFDLMKKVFTEFSPDVVVHTAGITRPETSDEMTYEEVHKINAEAAKFVAERCDLIKAKLIFTSTDLIYNGDKGGMLKEDAEKNPLSNYAKTKVEAEELIKNTFGNYIILRTALLFGLGLNGSPNNFHNMLNNFREGKPSNLFFDQVRTPLELNNASEIINSLCKEDIKEITMNFAGKEKVTRVQLGEMLCDIGGFDKSLINPISMYDVETLKPVADVSLNTELLQSFGLKQNTLEEGIRRSLR